MANDAIGTVGNPIKLEIPAEAWRPSGDFDHGDALSRLSTTVVIGTNFFHVEAYETKLERRRLGCSHWDAQIAANPGLEEDLDKLQDIHCEGQPFEIMRIGLRDYAVFIFPFAT
jgi:hypothetical protein